MRHPAWRPSRQFLLTTCSAENKRDYRYNHCIADPNFPHKQHYRYTDVKPHGPCMSFADADKWIHLDRDSHFITNEKGWRMARANVCAREGTYYYEVKILKASTSTQQPDPADDGPQPHVRMGWARREAPLDAPVGFDGYSYGMTDIRFQTMHRSRPGRFIQPKATKKSSKSSAKLKEADQPAAAAAAAIDINDHVQVDQGDVIGLEIQLPSLRLHRKVVSGVYNPAVDSDDPAPSWKDTFNDDDPHDIIRDRIPVPYKSNMFFEIMDFSPTKAMEAYSDRTLALSTLPVSSTGPVPAGTVAIKQPPNPNHVEPPLRTLPHSAIRIYKNGRLVGTAFENLLAFLPPASAPNKSASSATQGFDDGMLGYFPAVACFSGGIAQVNFGTEDRGDGQTGFWFPPGEVSSAEKDPGESTTSRPIGERYKEQIAEDIVWDLVDEVGFFIQDGGFAGDDSLAVGGDGAEMGTSVGVATPGEEA